MTSDLLAMALTALRAQARAELEHANCPECDGEGDWAECGPCSERFGGAIDLRSEVLQLACPRAVLTPAARAIDALGILLEEFGIPETTLHNNSKTEVQLRGLIQDRLRELTRQRTMPF